MAEFEVTLIFKKSLSWLSHVQNESQRLSVILQEQIEVWQITMGLPAKPKIIFKVEGDSEYNSGNYAPLGFSVWVNGHRCAYSRFLIDLVYRSLIRQPIHSESSNLTDIQNWVLKESYQNHNIELKEEAIRFIAYLSAEAIISNSAAIVNKEFTKAFLTNCQEESKIALTEKVLKILLSFNISLSRRDVIVEHINRAIRTSLPAQIVAEELYSYLRPGIIEFHLSWAKLCRLLNEEHIYLEDNVSGPPAPPDNGTSFSIGDLRPEYAEAFKVWLDKLNSEHLKIGCYLQNVQLIVNSELEENAFQLRFNHRLCPVQYLMKDSVDKMGDETINASTSLLGDLANLKETNDSENNTYDINQLSSYQNFLSTIEHHDFILNILKQFDFDIKKTFSRNNDTQLPVPLEAYLFIEIAIFSIRKFSALFQSLLLTAEDVEYLLAQMYSSGSPSFTKAIKLVKSAYLIGYSPTRLTPILRYLLHQDIGIGPNNRHLEFILETLLQYFNDLDECNFVTGIGIPTEFSTFQLPYGSHERNKQTYQAIGEFIRVKWAQRYFSILYKEGKKQLSCYEIHSEIIQEISKLSSKHLSPEGKDILKRDLSTKILENIANILKKEDRSSTPFILVRDSADLLIKDSADIALHLHSLISADYPEIKIFHQDLLDLSLIEVETLGIIAI